MSDQSCDLGLAPVVSLHVWSWARSYSFYCLGYKPKAVVWVDWNNVCENALKKYKALYTFEASLRHYPYYCSGVLGRGEWFPLFMFWIVPNRKPYKGSFPIVFFIRCFWGEGRSVQAPVPEAPARSPPQAAGTSHWDMGRREFTNVT